jgi:hypothetical protein
MVDRIASIDIEAVFEHWRVSCRGETRGPKPVLTDKRRRLIAKAIHAYGLETCMAAAEGPIHSRWHQGANPGVKKYDSLELIFRNEEKIEQFATFTADAKASETEEPF